MSLIVHAESTSDAVPTGAGAIHAMLVGAPKAGTTSLYRYAVQHPAVHCHEQRELTHFFSDTEYHKGFDACVSKYMPSPRAEGSVFFAKHVFTMYSPDAVARLKTHNSSMHIFTLLRDPVKRAYSSYWYSRRRGWDPASSFEEAVRWEMQQPDQNERDWLNDRDRLHLRVGVYHPHIRRLIEVFGKERVHVFLTDDLSRDAAGLCRQIYQTIGVDAGFTPDLARTHNSAAAARSETMARVIAGILKSQGLIRRTIRKCIPHGLAMKTRHALLQINEKPFTPPPMPDDIRRMLIDYFAPYNKELGVIISRDLSEWSHS